MQLDLSFAFGPEELPQAERLLSASVRRTGKSIGELLRPALRELAFAEAGRPEILTEAAATAAEERAQIEEGARLQAAIESEERSRTEASVAERVAQEAIRIEAERQAEQQA